MVYICSEARKNIKEKKKDILNCTYTVTYQMLAKREIDEAPHGMNVIVCVDYNAGTSPRLRQLNSVYNY